MRVRGTGCVLIGKEGRSPPLPYVTVGDDEGRGLIAAKLAVEVVGEEATEAEGLKVDGPTIAEFVAAGYPATNYPPAGYESRSTADEIAAAIASDEAKAQEWADGEVAAREAAQAELAASGASAEQPTEQPHDGAGEGDGGSTEGQPTDESESGDAVDADAAKQAEIIEAFELLDEADFVKTGERKGRPKVTAVEAILGGDLTMADVDAAWAVKNAE